jgi:hypothetical protein
MDFSGVERAVSPNFEESTTTFLFPIFKSVRPRARYTDFPDEVLHITA